MSTTPSLTIAIPVYNRIDFIEKALKSAVEQDFVDEVIVVDNNSDHNFFRSICDKHDVKYYRNSSNLGVFGNWNRCFELAESEYVVILSDDDVLCPNYSDEFSAACRRHNFDIFYSNFEIIEYSSETIVPHSHNIPFGVFTNGRQHLLSALDYGLSFPMMTAAIRRDVFNGYYTQEHGSNDWAWIYTNGSTLSYFGVNKVLAFRGEHLSNDSKNRDTHIRCVASMAWIYDWMISHYSNEGDWYNMKRAMRRRDHLIHYLALAANSFQLNSILNGKGRYKKTLESNLSIPWKLLNRFLPYQLRRVLVKLLRRVFSYRLN